MADQVDASMPALFLGHGSPMNAIEDSAFRREWARVAAELPRPRAVLCVSAHWEARGIFVTSGESPETVHDFYGFPQALFDVRYPAPGDSALAQEVASIFAAERAHLDPDRGLDHGAWSVLIAMYPRADVPVVQLSLDRTLSPAAHYELGRRLAPLRERGVLILGSGNVVHNLGVIDFGREGGFDWAERFDDEVKRRIETRDHDALVRYAQLGRDAALSIPTPEHYLPLLYVLALARPEEPIVHFNEAVTMGSISMRSLVIGAPRL